MWSDPSKTIPTSIDPAESWINWHKRLLKWFSKDEANQQWIRFWTQRAGAGTTADTHDLRIYMKDQGVDISTTITGSLTDGAASVAEWFGNAFSGIKSLIFGVIILAIGLFTIYVLSNIQKGNRISDMATDMRSIRTGSKVNALGSQKLLT